MRVSEARSTMLLATLLDGQDGAPDSPCPSPLCRRPRVRFVTSAGLRAQAPALPVTQDVCVSKRCPMALAALPFLSAIQGVSG